jgi:hypothetical protein
MQLGKLHFHFDGTHVLPDAKLGRCESNVLPLGLSPTPCGENVRIGYSRRRDAYCRVNRVIVGLDKFRQNVYISVGIYKCRVLLVYLRSSYEHVTRRHI